jgi:signal transduction histidine kinase
MPNDTQARLESAAELGRRATAGHDLAVLLAHAMEAICDQLRVDFSSYLELLPDGKGIFQAGVGWKAGVVGHATVEMSGESAAGHVIRTLSPLAIADLGREERFVISPLLREHGIVSALIVPLLGESRPLGVLGAHGARSRVFSPEEIAWLQVVAHTLSARLERKWLGKSDHDQQLLRAEQMMAIGQVAAGVAHELRNPLTSIKGLIQVNLRELGHRGLPTDDLEVIEHEIRRMEKTLQTFLDFARPPRPDRRLQPIAPIVERVMALVGGRARKQHVELKFLRQEPLAQAKVDGDQIQQLLLNLVLNALDAMPQGGCIEIELASPRDGFLEIYVRDTGPGIAAHILPKVFETFVSSKETGVGLGLPLSRRFAEDHGGTLSAYNLPVEGACFLLRLPVAAQ